MDDQQIRELAEELPHVQHDRQRLDQELNKLQAGLDTFNIFSTESSSLQRPSIFAKPASRHSSLSQSLDPIAIRKKTKPQSKWDNRNSNTTTASTRNVNPAFGTPTSISTSLLFSRSSSSGDSSNANNPSKEKLPFNSLGSHTWNTPRPSDGLFGPLPFSNVETAKSSAEIGQGLFLAPRFGQSSGSSSIFGSTDTTAKYDPKEPPATEGLNR
ncbi:unnamed protein product [Aspergillus oryzae var. brunneus]|uniref:Unnamed protein product n=2 Tax=Aspergillus oryzae TaxID=5062 RepID=A0AAN4Y971_ASPOZ|nr:unnamed protein product [Aspergillus oryzae]GMG50421.1 unnamed protein product [Aspergillus oryzae var. brunneus]